MSASRTGNLSPRARKWVRRGLILAVVAGVLGTTYYLALPHVVEAYIRSQLDDLGESSGRTITFESFELIKLHKYSFYDFRVSDPGEHRDADFLTADRITVTLDRTRLFTGRVVVRGIEMESPVVHLRDYDDGSSNYARLWRRLRVQLGMEPPEAGPPDSTATAEPPPANRTERVISEIMGGALPDVSITGARLDVAQAADGAPPGLSNVDIGVESAGQGLACTFTMSAEFEAVETALLARPLGRLELHGNVNVDDELAEVMLGTGEPMEIRDVPGLPDVALRVEEVGFEYPYTFHVRGLEVLERRTREPVVVAPDVTVSLRELTLDPESFYISLFQADGLRLYVELERSGRTNLDRLLGLDTGPFVALVPPELREPVDEPGDSDGGSASSDDGEAEPSAWARELDRRKWWEVAPQTTVLSDFRMELTVAQDEGLRTLDLHLPEVRASKRLLNFQMDVTTSLELSERNEGEIAALSAEFVYFYMTDHWGLEAGLGRLDLGRLVDIFPYPNPFDLQSGELSGSLAVAESRPEGQLRLEGELDLSHFAFAAQSLDDAQMQGIDLAYAFAAEVDDESNVDTTRGELVLNDVEAEVEVDITALDPPDLLAYLLDFKEPERREGRRDEPDPLPFTSVRLRVDLPRQPVMDVLRAVPEALRARLGDVEMTGDVGWRLDATATFELDERGRLQVEVPRPEEADVLDEGLELVALPPDIDVRRLLEPEFTFTFSDGIGETRILTLSPESPRWVTLDQIAEPMVLSILNTEDQGFFENQGFNWYQFRRVIADLLEDRAFGRGASTITMQLVKNVFLSRERLLSRKLAEMFLTYWMSRLVPKERILEVYLNVIEFGPGVNGIAEAAEHYFGKLPGDLTLSEATFLVSIVPNPREYHFYYEQGAITDRWWQHMQRYIERLYAREVITEEEYLAALDDRPEFYLPAEGDPALRPEEPEEPALPPEILLPFLEDVEARRNGELPVHPIHDDGRNDGVRDVRP